MRARELWRVAEPWLEQAQDDATLLAIRDMERAGIEMVQILKEGGRARSTAVVTPVTTEPRAEKPAA